MAASEHSVQSWSQRTYCSSPTRPSITVAYTMNTMSTDNQAIHWQPCTLCVLPVRQLAYGRSSPEDTTRRNFIPYDNTICSNAHTGV